MKRKEVIRLSFFILNKYNYLFIVILFVISTLMSNRNIAFEKKFIDNKDTNVVELKPLQNGIIYLPNDFKDTYPLVYDNFNNFYITTEDNDTVYGLPKAIVLKIDTLGDVNYALIFTIEGNIVAYSSMISIWIKEGDTMNSKKPIGLSGFVTGIESKSVMISLQKNAIFKLQDSCILLENIDIRKR